MWTFLFALLAVSATVDGKTAQFTNTVPANYYVPCIEYRFGKVSIKKIEHVIYKNAWLFHMEKAMFF